VLESMKQAGFPTSGSANDREKALDRGGVFPATDAKPEPRAAVRPWKLSPAMTAAPEASASRPNDEFLLITYSLPFHRSHRSSLNRWLLEVMPENRIAINPADAKKLSIAQGDPVVIEMGDPARRFSCRSHIMPGIMPGVVALAQGFGYRQCGVLSQTIDGTAGPVDKTPAAGLNAADLVSVGKTVRLKKG
jgi:anaerobic selenocysteine-containing dehydrogenase